MQICSWHGRIDGAIGCGRGLAGLYEVHAEHGDHRAIVGAQLEPRDAHLDSGPLAVFEQLRTQLRVGGEPSAYDQSLGIILLAPAHGLTGQNRGHGVSQRSAHVVNGNVPPRRLLFLNPPCDAVLTPEKLKSYGCAAPAFP